jgi:hypothetical protein
MTFEKGATNPKTIKANAEKQQVLDLVSEGMSLPNAMTKVGKQPDTARIWVMRDTDFARRLEQAKIDAKSNSLKALGIPKDEITFAQFSEMYLESKVFPHHQDWIDLIEGREPSWLHPSMIYEKADETRLLVNVPPEHAKSTVVTVNYSTYRIALNPNVRIIVVSKTLNKAREFVYSIKNRLSHPRYGKMQNAFGPEGGWKADADTWKVDTVYLGGDARDSSEKDPTIQALGMGGQIYGARADLIILDDCITTANAHEYEKQINWLQKEVITRLGKNGKLLIVGTRIAATDFYRELREPKYWSSGKCPFSYMGMPAVLEYADKVEDWVTLWPKSNIPWDGDDEEDIGPDGLYPKWDGRALNKRRGEVTASTWALVYQQEDIAEDSTFPASLVQGCINGMRKRGVLNQDLPGHPERINGYTIIGFDPAMTGNSAFVVINYNSIDGCIYVLDCINMSEPTPQKIRNTIEELVIRYRPNEFRVEINAHQKGYALDSDLIQWLAQYGCALKPHFTGKNKWDTNLGVASMSTFFGTSRDGKFQNDNSIEFPSTEGSEGMKSLLQQLMTWKPNTKGKTDCVMALWFAVLRAKELMQAASFTSRYKDNRWATKAQLSKRASVNLDAAYQEQWNEQFG